MDDTKKNVVVTGFGPFGKYEKNPSWEAVKCLKEIGLDRNVNLLIHQIPVVYSKTTLILEELWNEQAPLLMINVGVGGPVLALETRAHNTGYYIDDNDGKTPPFCVAVPGGADILYTKLDTKLALRTLQESGIDVKAVISENAGRFLCEFSFYTSLNKDSSRTDFIHVPPVETPAEIRKVAMCLKVLVENYIDQVLHKQ